jgi:hypothetical protein
LVVAPLLHHQPQPAAAASAWPLSIEARHPQCAVEIVVSKSVLSTLSELRLGMDEDRDEESVEERGSAAEGVKKAMHKSGWRRVSYAAEPRIDARLALTASAIELRAFVPRLGGKKCTEILGTYDITGSSPPTSEQMNWALSENLRNCRYVLDELSSTQQYSCRGKMKHGARNGKRTFIDDLTSNTHSTLRLRLQLQLCLAREVLANKDESLMLLICYNEAENVSVIYESRSSMGSYQRLLEGLDQDQHPWLGEHIFVSAGDSLVGRNAAHFHLSSLTSINASHQSRELNNLLEALHRGGPSLQYSLLVKNPGAGKDTVWKSAPGSDGISLAPSGASYHYYGDAFSKDSVVFAVESSVASNLFAKSRYDLWLSSLMKPYFTGDAPSTIDVSRFLSLWPPCFLKILLNEYSKLRRSLELSSVDEPFLFPCQKVFELAFGGHASSPEMLASSNNGDVGFSVHEQTSDAIESSYDDDMGANFDFQEEAPLQSASANGCHRGTSSSISHIIPQIATGGSGGGYDISFATFASEAMKNFVCLELLECHGIRHALIALIDYNYDTLARTNGKPVLTEVNVNAGSINVNCRCYASYMADLTTEHNISGVEGKKCYHAQLLHLPNAFDTITKHPRSLCDFATGRPRSIAVTVLSIFQGRNDTSGVPRRAYVYVTGPAGYFRRGAILLVRKLNRLVGGRGYSVSCDACGSGSKSEKGIANRHICGHFEELRKAIAAGEETHSSSIRLVSRILSHEPVAAVVPPLFDEENQQWQFPSLELDVLKSRSSTVKPLKRPAFTSLHEAPPGPMGGPNDPATTRSEVTFDVLRGDDISLAVFRRSLVNLYCTPCSSAALVQLSFGIAHFPCWSCGAIIPNGTFGKCSSQSCSSSICEFCLVQQVRSQGIIEPKFYEAFSEFYHLKPDCNEFRSLESFIYELEGICALNTKGSTPVVLKPPLPKVSGNPACQCAYIEDGYKLAERSTIFGLTSSEDCLVFDLECTMNHDGCLIRCAGQDRGNIFRFSTETLFWIEVFDFFWKVQKDMRGSSAMSFVSLVQAFYTRNNNNRSFVSEPTFRDAFFGYMSLKKINLNQRCIQCPVYKDPDTGVLYSGCKIVGYDCVTLHTKKDEDSSQFYEPTADSPTVNCKKVHIYDRLFFPGKLKSDIGQLRVETESLALCVQEKRSKVPNDCEFETLADRISLHSVIQLFAPAVRLVALEVCARADLDHNENYSILAMRIADVLVAMCNPQGEVFQVANFEEAHFCLEALRLEAAGELKPSFLQAELEKNVRASIVEVVRAGLLPIHTPGEESIFRLNEAVKSMLTRIHKTSFEHLRKAVKAPKLPIIPKAQRKRPNPARDGIMVNNTQGGEQLRLCPDFTEGGPVEVDPRICDKRQFKLVNKHHRHMHRTQCVMNLVCMPSQQSVGIVIMDGHEGRSHGILLMYCFMPYFQRMVVCDTGCQSASWAHTHLMFFFFRWKFVIDRFHHFGHKCTQVTDPSEFRIMNGMNDSYVEQLHAIQRALSLTIESTSRPRSMFLLQLLQHAEFCRRADKAGVPMAKRDWPDPESVPFGPSTHDFEAVLNSAENQANAENLPDCGLENVTDSTGIIHEFMDTTTEPAVSNNAADGADAESEVGDVHVAAEVDDALHANEGVDLDDEDDFSDDEDSELVEIVLHDDATTED